MIKPQWRTLSIRINPKTRKAVALQTRVPLTAEEWDALIASLEKLKPELTQRTTDA